MNEKELAACREAFIEQYDDTPENLAVDWNAALSIVESTLAYARKEQAEQIEALRKDAERYRIDAEDSLEHARQLVILLQTIEGSLKTHSAAEVLDENSPIREAIRDAIPFQLQPSDRIVKEKSAIDSAIAQEKGK